MSRYVVTLWVLLRSLFEQFVSSVRALISSLRLSVAILLLSLILGGMIAHALGVARDDIQVAVFPLVCLLLAFLPRDPSLRLPGGVVMLSLLLWSGAVFSTQIIQPYASSDKPYFSISRLHDDAAGVFVRQFSKRYETIAETYSLPPYRILEKTFGTRAEAAQWLAAHSSKQLFVIRGAREWIEVVLNPLVRWTKELEGYQRLDQAAELGEHSQIATIPITIGWVPRPLLLATLPRSIDAPAGAKEFILHAIGWLSAALASREESDQADAIEQRAQTRDALTQLSVDARIGLSNGIAAVGQFLQALTLLEEYSEQGGFGRPQIDEALRLLRDAATFAKMESDPELFSMIFNNAGVALMTVAETPEELYKARFWIRMAHDASAFGQGVPSGSQIAMENLVRLDEAEAVVPEGVYGDQVLKKQQ